MREESKAQILQYMYAHLDTVTRVCVTALDDPGGRMPYIQECVRVSVDGPARLLGPERFPLTAGTSAFWIATTGEPGTVTVRVEGMRGSAECSVTVV